MAPLISYNNGQFPSSLGLSYLACEMGMLMSALPQVTDGRATCGPDQGTARRFPGVNLDCSSYLLVSYKQPGVHVVLNTAPWGSYEKDDRGCASLGFYLCTQTGTHTHAHTGVVEVGLWPTLSTDLQPSLPQDIASPKFSMPSPVRTVIAADFDNDQELEVFFNNFAHRSSSANRLFR